MSRITDVKQAATALEAYFLRRVLAEVRTSDNGVASGGFAGDMFKEMFDEAVADKMAAAGGIGLAKVISRQLDPTAGKAKSAPAGPAPVDGATAGITLGGSRGGGERASGVEGAAGAATPPAAPSPGPAARPATPILRGGVTIRPYHSAASRALTTPPLESMSGTSAFGRRSDPIEGDLRQHNGLDLGAAEGTPVRAAGDGTVKFAADAGTYGNLVVVDHGGGLETRYAHLSQIAVKVGDPVPAGGNLGAVGQTGRSTGPHLHFEVRRDGQPADPQGEFAPSSFSVAGRPTDWR